MASMNSSSQRGPPRGGGGNPGHRNSRGGIQKKGQSRPPRTDRDGDMNMDGPDRGRGRLAPPRARSKSNSQTRNGTRDDNRRGNRPARNPFSSVKKAIEQSDGKGKTSGAARFAAAMAQATHGSSSPAPAGQSRIAVRGWAQSKAAANPGGCQQQLVEFLERKASNTGNPADRKNVRISKSQVDGDTLTIYVNSDFAPSLVHLNGFSFAGAPLTIEEKQQPKNSRPSQQSNESTLSETGKELKDRIKSMLERRYNANTKILDLSSLGTDPEFANSGMFDSASTQSKFFPALMKVCSDMAPTAAKKRDTIHGVSLTNNNLPDINTVTTLAPTFPDLKNLDLSNNNIRTLKALDPWRRKFRSLEHLVLSNNPLETEVPNFHEEVMKWYPTLRFLNGVQVRTDEQVAAASQGKLAVPVARPCFKDESAIGENFIKFFFPNFDNDRTNLVTNFYDANATFSYSINTAAKRVEKETPEWSQYIKGSRNMVKITSVGGRKQRISKGTENVRDMWSRLPVTRHPDLATEMDKWCIECHPLAGLPDPSATTAGGAGVGGLIIYVHGEFGEVDVSNMQVKARRSFDRTFVLGPGGGLGGIRVISDMLVVRAYGGHEAFKPTEEAEAVQPSPNIAAANLLAVPSAGVGGGAATPDATGLVVPDGFAAPAPGKTDEQVQKERLALELSRATRLTLEYAAMCLEQTEWNLEAAGQSFQEARANLPPDAFY